MLRVGIHLIIHTRTRAICEVSAIWRMTCTREDRQLGIQIYAKYKCRHRLQGEAGHTSPEAKKSTHRDAKVIGAHHLSDGLSGHIGASAVEIASLSRIPDAGARFLHNTTRGFMGTQKFDTVILQ